MTAAAIALNRLCRGARPDEAPPAGPQRWLLSQLDACDWLPASWLQRIETNGWDTRSARSARLAAQPRGLDGLASAFRLDPQRTARVLFPGAGKGRVPTLLRG